MNLEDEETHFLPPRNSVHPSENGKWAHLFYQTLLLLFILLLISLIIWGTRYS